VRALLLALLAVGCGGEALPHARSYTVTYTLVSAEGNCPPYAPEHLHLSPQVTDLSCVWVPLEGDLGLNLLCTAGPLPTVEPLSWSPDGTGSVRISYPPTCSGIYDVLVTPAE
jgi:hypothetical protein